MTQSTSADISDDDELHQCRGNTSNTPPWDIKKEGDIGVEGQSVFFLGLHKITQISIHSFLPVGVTGGSWDSALIRLSHRNRWKFLHRFSHVQNKFWILFTIFMFLPFLISEVISEEAKKKGKLLRACVSVLCTNCVGVCLAEWCVSSSV